MKGVSRLDPGTSFVTYLHNDLQFLNLKILGTLLKANKISPIVGKTAFVFFT